MNFQWQLGIDTEITFRNLHVQSNYSFFGECSFVFPMEVGSKWAGDHSGDTTTVLSMADTVRFFGRMFTDVYNVKRVYINNDLGIRMIQFLRIKPGVGIIAHSFNLREEGEVPQQQSLFLLDFELK